MSASRVWMSAMRWGSVAVSASAMSAWRSVSAASTVSSTDRSVAGDSCATPPMRAREGRLIVPPSSVSSPRISRNSVVLPAPFGPTRPTLCPVGITAEAWSNSGRPAME